DAGGANADEAASAPAPAADIDELTARILELAERGGLTPRETEVFDLLARGRSIPYVRDALVISRETAATHAKHVYAKLDVHSRQELIDLVH
ncbi:MAG: helix-turn-helix transcriptional regulator, partial [Eggerthella sp.]|nr:helix-turn-helix transcriptional regulator [Eggerthella sp.]